MKLVEYKNGWPVFGVGELKGWGIAMAGANDERERTLRNAALAALMAESGGHCERALAIWHTELEGGTVAELFVHGLPIHVSWLERMAEKKDAKTVDTEGQAKREAVEKRKREIEADRAARPDPTPRSPTESGVSSPGRIARATLAPNQVQHMVDERSKSLGRPVLHRWQATPTRGVVLLYEWPEDEEWLAFEVDVDKREAVELRERPVSEERSKRQRKAAGSKEAERASAPRPAPLPEQAVLALKIDVPSAIALVEAVLDSPEAHQGKAREAKSYKACSLCVSPIGRGQEWIAKNQTTRGRIHIDCFRPIANHLIGEREAAK